MLSSFGEEDETQEITVLSVLIYHLSYSTFSRKNTVRYLTVRFNIVRILTLINKKVNTDIKEGYKQTMENDTL